MPQSEHYITHYVNNAFYKFFNFLAGTYSFGFAATFFLMPSALITSFYTYYFIAGTGDLASRYRAMVAMTLTITLILLTIFHVVYVGLLHKVGFSGFTRSIRRINTYLTGEDALDELHKAGTEEIKAVYRALLFFPRETFILTTLLALFLILVTSINCFRFFSNYAIIPFILIGGVFAALVYGYFSFTLIEYFIGPTKVILEKLLFQRVDSFETNVFMSFKGKSVFTQILIIFDMVLLVIILQTSRHQLLETVIFMLISFGGIGLLIFLLHNSISLSLEHINSATKELAAGGMGLYFSMFLDRELVQFSENYNMTAREVNRLREDLEKSIDDRTSELNEAYERLSDVYKQILADLNISRRIQSRIFPKNIDRIDGLAIAIHYSPMTKIGGDIYDVVTIRPGYIRVLLADAMGNGVQAALVAMIIKTEYEKLKYLESPADLLEQINRSFFESYGILNVFFSSIIIDIDLAGKQLIYASAGHPDQFLVCGGNLVRIEHTGKLAGIMYDARYELERFRVRSGDKILLFTDGLFEQFNKDNLHFGKENVLEVVERAKGLPVGKIVDDIITTLQTFLDNSEHISIYDDITIIGIEIE